MRRNSGNSYRRRMMALAQHCLRDGPSRDLDGAIFCAVHALGDLNDLADLSRRLAREAGEVLVLAGDAGAPAWVQAPPFTADIRYAEMLMPSGLYHIGRAPCLVCATGLAARALSREPPFVLHALPKAMSHG